MLKISCQKMILGSKLNFFWSNVKSQSFETCFTYTKFQSCFNNFIRFCTLRFYLCCYLRKNMNHLRQCRSQETEWKLFYRKNFYNRSRLIWKHSWSVLSCPFCIVRRTNVVIWNITFMVSINFKRLQTNQEFLFYLMV